MATYDQTTDAAGNAVLSAEANDTSAGTPGVVTTDASGMQEITVTASKIVGYDWSQWLKPPKLYYLGALAAAVLYLHNTKKRK